MAALLVALGVMAVMMAAVLPAWRHQAQREKEEELIFRGEQYVRAIGLWERKMGPGSRPPSFDVLVDQKFLRKKYKDPMTEDGEFVPVVAGMNQQPTAPGPQRGRGQNPSPQPTQPAPQAPTFGPQQGQGLAGGILGVRSKSKDTSIRIYKGATHYNEWPFMFAGAGTGPGGAPGVNTPGRGNRGLPGPGGFGGRDGRGGGPGGGPRGGRGIGPGMPPTIGPGRGRGQ